MHRNCYITEAVTTCIYIFSSENFLFVSKCVDQPLNLKFIKYTSKHRFFLLFKCLHCRFHNMSASSHCCGSGKVQTPNLKIFEVNKETIQFSKWNDPYLTNLIHIFKRKIHIKILSIVIWIIKKNQLIADTLWLLLICWIFYLRKKVFNLPQRSQFFLQKNFPLKQYNIPTYYR